jgi:hypothetical protein
MIHGKGLLTYKVLQLFNAKTFQIGGQHHRLRIARDSSNGHEGGLVPSYLFAALLAVVMVVPLTARPLLPIHTKRVHKGLIEKDGRLG